MNVVSFFCFFVDVADDLENILSFLLFFI